MNKVLGITILYYPSSELTDNIKSYLDELDCLIIWENTPDKDNLSLIPQSEKIIKMGKKKNVGIGRALNAAVEYGLANDFDYLLTMDQDSYFPGNSCYTYFKSIFETKSTAFFCPNYVMDGKQLYAEEASLKKIDLSMTSGSVYPIKVFKKIGLFREDFFIDGIDTEICLRAILYNIPTLANTEVKLIHNLGNGVPKSFLGRHYTIRNYSKTRLYYIYRNNVILKRLYRDAKIPAIKKLFTTKLNFHKLYFVYIKHVLLFENQKMSKLLSVIRGIKDGCIYKTGKPY